MSSYVGEGEYKKVEEKKDFYERKRGLVPKPESKELFEKEKLPPARYAVGELTADEVEKLEDYTSQLMLVGV